MTVAHIAFLYGEDDSGGAAIAATRLHKALLAAGVDSHYICAHQHEAGKNIHQLPHGLSRIIYRYLTKGLRCIWKLSSLRDSVCLNLIPMFGLEKILRNIKPDVIHVHWLNADVASFEQIAELSYKRVFNLHDLWVLNAIKPHPCGDRRFVAGFTTRNSSRLERFLFRRKRDMIRKSRPDFIGPSEWACHECEKSIIGRGCRTHVIPNVINPIFFKDTPVVRKRNEKFVILFGAYGGRWSPFKGFDDLCKAIELLSREVKETSELRIFGESAAETEIYGVPVSFLGTVHESSRLREIYLSADVFAFPSRQETQGMTKIEAMLCGLPVVAFDRSACAEGIEHGVTGWIAQNGNVAQFADGLSHYNQKWKSNDDSEMRKDVIRLTKRKFSTSVIISRLLKVYECEKA